MVKAKYLEDKQNLFDKTNKEFEMRHEYHTPFGKPQKARGGGIAIRGMNFKGVL